MARTVRQCPHGRAGQFDLARTGPFHEADAWHWLRRKRRELRAMHWQGWRTVRLRRRKAGCVGARVPRVVVDACVLPPRHLT
eukprot:6195688-Pleurochrysis_carterae.AAC.1